MITIRHPKTIIIKNEFYPNGLEEQDLFNYYMSHKKEIFKSTFQREVMLFINIKLNESIVKRKYQGNFIYLTNRNYEQFIHGRVVSIHNTMNKSENFGIVDIDTDDFEEAKKVALELYNYFKSITSNPVEIRFTGKSSFHVVRYLYRKQDINQTRELLREQLTEGFGDRYLIGKTRTPNKINLDLSPNKYKGGFIALDSLSVLGLKCMIIDPTNLKRFRKEDAKIK